MSRKSDNILSISVETSGRIGSVAVARGADVLAGDFFSTQHHHGVELLPTVDRLCSRQGIDPGSVEHVYVSGGPGSFTGLRIGITFARAMAFATGVKVVRVPTLDAMAQNALDLQPQPRRVVAILDAKRRHIYCASFELTAEAYVNVDGPAERDPLEYLPRLGPVVGLGEGIAYHLDAVNAAGNVTIAPESLNRARAEVILLLGRRMAADGRFTPINELIPIYIRRPEAVEKWEQRHGPELPGGS